MATANQQAEQHIGESKGVSNHLHDLIHDLSNRLDAIWRYDQYMANAKAGGNKEEGKLWGDLKKSEMKIVERLKSLLHKSLGEHLGNNA